MRGLYRYKFLRQPQDTNYLLKIEKSDNVFEERKKLIFNYFDVSLSRTSLVKLAYKLLNSTENKFIVYSDGSLTNLGNPLTKSTFAFIMMNENFTELGSFMSSNRFWMFSYRAETFGLLTSLMVLPFNASVKIFTDSQSMIETFKSTSNNSLLLTVLEIIEKLQLKVELLKVKAHAKDDYNNKVG
jgi:ribonuclease HI